ncbi:MAG: hypothetical protein MUE83_06265 [Tabrizicola sp.]|jgi:hypothetical protein|nr:hypothetical protein [Tabrizicola sp.]
MIRNQLCEIAGINAATFNSHRRNGDLPFDLSGREVAANGRTWSRFSLYDAMLLIAAKDLASGQGVSWAEAAQMLRQPAIYTQCYIGDSRASFRSPGFHCARLVFRRQDGPPHDLFRQDHVVRGTLPGIVGYAERATRRHNERARHVSDLVALFSLVTVNLSQAWDTAVDRAAKFPDIEAFADDFEQDERQEDE